MAKLFFKIKSEAENLKKRPGLNKLLRQLAGQNRYRKRAYIENFISYRKACINNDYYWLSNLDKLRKRIKGKRRYASNMVSMKDNEK
ncbi:hypothetical protein Mgra_00010183 [Meloidogyne graminicola]|uniref:Uncharacterized protein n=1 Tax=Meloidogyne graminicola TaxID=189291 RepID=A0A8S9ZAI6_9BILA|nr:hypothetical protein Mgra_00010183 [Meloidogyne graminicola]